MRDELFSAIGGCAATIIVLAMGALSGCADERSAAADLDSSVPVAAGSAGDGVIRRGPFRQTVLLTGELRSEFGESIVVPNLPSWETTIRWMVPDGGFVAEGDRVVELDTAQIASELENKITARQQALNQVASTQAEIESQFAQKRFAVERTRIALRKAEIEASVPIEVQSDKLHREKQLAYEQARVEQEKAVADLAGYQESSAAELEVLNIDFRTAEREVAEARRAIDTMVLRAPQSGLAVAAENRREGRKFQVGDAVWVGRQVMEIPDLSRMVVQARLSDVDDGKIAVGMRARCTLDAYPDRHVGGTIVAVGPVAQERDFRSLQREFAVRLRLDESWPEIMRPGMSVKVEIETITRADALLVPRTALRYQEAETMVVLEGGEQQPLTLGPCNAHVCIVEQGPPAGTRVAGP